MKLLPEKAESLQRIVKIPNGKSEVWMTLEFRYFLEKFDKKHSDWMRENLKAQLYGQYSNR